MRVRAHTHTHTHTHTHIQTLYYSESPHWAGGKKLLDICILLFGFLATLNYFRSPEKFHCVFFASAGLYTYFSIHFVNINIRYFRELAGQNKEKPCPLTQIKSTHISPSTLQLYLMKYQCRLWDESLVCEGLACPLSAHFVLSGILCPPLLCTRLGSQQTEK